MKKWTQKDKVFLIKNFQTMSNVELANHFNVTEDAIKNILFRLKIRRTRKLKVDNVPVQATVTCAPIRVQTCAPQIVIHNGKPLEYWGKNFEAFKQRLSK